MDITFRAHRYDDADYEAQHALHMLLHGEEFPMSLHEWRTWIEGSRANAAYFCRWEVAEVEGQIVAFGVCRQAPEEYKPGWYAVELRVYPEYRRQGIGAAWLQRNIEALVQRQGEPLRGMCVFVRDDNTSALTFVEKHGFLPTLKNLVSRLEVQAFDPGAYDALVAQLAEQGITIHSLTELQAIDPDWKQKVWVLFEMLMPDVPSTLPYSPMAIEEFERIQLSGPFYSPEAYFVARQGDDLVGLSSLQLREEGTSVDTNLTGALRSHRRMGIATALKVRAIAFARSRRIQHINTSNEENNPMYKLNQQLGFMPRPSWIQFVREFPETP